MLREERWRLGEIKSDAETKARAGNRQIPGQMID
jgi:hypothetical protein